MGKNKLKLLIVGLGIAPLFLAFQNFTSSNTMLGNVDGVTSESDGVPMISGWTCEQGNSAAIQTNTYLGGIYAGGGVYSPSLSNIGVANFPSEAVANSSCIGASHNFSIPIPASVLASSSGQSIYVYGLYPSPQTGAGLLTGSGSFTVPLPVIGNINGIATNASGALITGWACYAGSSNPITVGLFSGNAYPRGEGVTHVTTDLPTTDPAVINACGSAGNYNFSIQISSEQLFQFSGQGIYIHGISPVGGTNPLLHNSGVYKFPSSAATPCKVTDITSLQSCATGSNQLISFMEDVTCSGAACCTGFTSTFNLDNQNYRVIHGNGHTLHRLADSTGVGYEFQCPAMSLSNSNFVKITSLNFDEDETVPACTVAVDGSLPCNPTISVNLSHDIDFENVKVFNGKSYVVNVSSSGSVTFNNSVIANAGVIGFHAGNNYLGPSSEYIFLTNSVIARTSTNGVAFGEVSGLYYGANAIENNVFSGNHHRGAWQAGGGSLITGGQLYLPSVNFLNVDNNVIADGACNGCPANDGQVWAMELGGGSPTTPTALVNYLQVWGNYIYNGFGLPYLLNGGAQFGGNSVLGGYALASEPADKIEGFEGNSGSFTGSPNLANFSLTALQQFRPANQVISYPAVVAGALLSVRDSVSNSDPTLYRNGISDSTIYLLQLSNGSHLIANTPTEQPGASLVSVFGLSPSPRLGASNSRPIYRCRLSVGGENYDEASLSQNCGSGSTKNFHSILGYSYEPGHAGAMQIFACAGVGSVKDGFVSQHSDCGNNTTGVSLGYAVQYRYLSTITDYTQGLDIEINRPNTTAIGGLFYTIAPALPAGLSFNNNNGLISGMPTAPIKPTNFVVTVSGTIIPGQGPTQVSLPLVISVKPQLAYTQPTASYTQGLVITPNTLTDPSAAAYFTGGFRISPALPAGLSFNASTGAITGTPTAAILPNSRYSIVAVGAAGVASIGITLNP